MSRTNYREIFAQQRAAEERIIKYFGDPSENSGIYLFGRFNERRCCNCYYIGQAKNLRRRIAQHLLEHDHIANSLEKYGLFDREENPKGWNCGWWLAHEKELDRAERDAIAYYKSLECSELYNITSGGQGNGKTDIAPRAERKGYRKGKQDGIERATSDIGMLIVKYTTGLTSKGGAIADRKTRELKERLKITEE